MADYQSKYTGNQVEALLDIVSQGGTGGGGEIDLSNYATKEEVNAKYTKPSDGIPASDLAADVFLQGEKGEKGDTGPQGPQGPQGPKGDTGEQGPKGDKGDKGDQGEQGPSGTNGTNGTNGKDGVGISSVKQTTTSTADGGNNVVTVTLTNGTTSTFNVKNGSKGSNGTNGTNGTNGKDGENGATFTPSVDANGNLSWTNDKGLANPATVNIKGPKGDSGDSGGGAGTIENPFIVISDSYCEIPPNTTVIFNEKHWFYEIGFELSSSNSFCDEFRAIFTTPFDGSELTIYGSLKWINGEPVINGDTTYELSVLIYKEGFGDEAQGLAVLTPFE